MPISKLKILVCGDSMLDCSVHSKHFRRTPEDPLAPVLRGPNLWGDHVFAGAAADVAMNLKAMGCDVVLASNISFDPAGQALMRILDRNKISQCGPLFQGVTTVKTRYYENGRIIARHDIDSSCSFGLGPNLDTPGKVDAVIVTDYGKGVVTSESLSRWIGWAGQKGIPIYFDPKVGCEGVLFNLSVGERSQLNLVANYLEAMAFLRLSSEDDLLTGWVELPRRIARALSIRSVIVKNGVSGSSWIREGCVTGSVRAIHPRQVFDVQGAGDTYIAALVAARCRGADFDDACLFASAAAGVAVGIPGTAVVSTPEIVSALSDHEIASPRGRISYEAASQMAKRLSGLGFRIGMTGGCFDLVLPHPGHVSTIQAAAEQCDFLFVAVDSDARVRNLKGSGRPVNPDSDRADSMGALRGVGASFVFDCSIEQVVRDLRPDVLIKGADYEKKGVPEASLLAEWGGELYFAPTIQTQSTTDRLSDS